MNVAFGEQLGTAYKTGHCDYWINCGHFQPACGVENFGQLLLATNTLEKRLLLLQQNVYMDTSCAHFRAAMVYLSAAQGDCDYKTEVCADCGAPLSLANLGLTCTHAGVGYKMPPLSECVAGDNKNFYVSSVGADPYCNAPATGLLGLTGKK